MGYVALGSKNIGDIIKIKVDGVPWEFIIGHKGKPSSSFYDDSFNNGVLVFMKDLYALWRWHSANTNLYETSEIDSRLNTEFYNLVDPEIRNKIKKVKIPYRGGKGSSGLSRNIFLLSAREVDIPAGSSYVEDGYPLSYFAGTYSSYGNSLVRASYQGSYEGWWLRTPMSALPAEQIRFINKVGNVVNLVAQRKKHEETKETGESKNVTQI